MSFTFYVQVTAYLCWTCKQLAENNALFCISSRYCTSIYVNSCNITLTEINWKETVIVALGVVICWLSRYFYFTFISIYRSLSNAFNTRFLLSWEECVYAERTFPTFRFCNMWSANLCFKKPVFGGWANSRGFRSTYIWRLASSGMGRFTTRQIDGHLYVT